MKWVHLMKKGQAGNSMCNFIADVAKPAKLDIMAVCTDQGGKPIRDFQVVLTQHSIRRELTPPDTPQYNRVAEQALGILQEKDLAMQETSVHTNAMKV